jgi:hypothetical protein
MHRSALERLLSPWVFVLTGIFFNILSALIAHYFIGLNNDAINLMDRDRGNPLGLLLDVSAAAQAAIIESINGTYLQTIELHEARMPLESDNSRLFSIAIFLQVTGLILVLARDLRSN